MAFFSPNAIILTASYIIHNNERRILLRCQNHAAINDVIKQIPGRRYSRTLQSWHIPVDKKSYGILKNNLPPGWLIEEIKEKTTLVAEMPVKLAEPSGRPALLYKNNRLSALNAHALDIMIIQLKLKAYSASTIRTYTVEFSALLAKLGHVDVNSLHPGHLKRYMLYCTNVLKLSENSLHSRLNALKFYFEQVLHKEKFFFEIPRPKKQLQLPHFFNQDEIAAIINAVENLKHKTMLMISYSSGLRVSEVVSIKTKNIDSKRMTILIEQAKGKKDRVVKLSPVLLIMLREYWKKFKPAKNGFLFAGQVKDEAYHTRSLQLIMAAAKKKAGILKEGSIHALRHSFATHLLDKGTDVTMIMKLLGHNDIKTTLRYLHVTNRDILSIVSPLDDLKLK